MGKKSEGHDAMRRATQGHASSWAGRSRSIQSSNEDGGATSEEADPSDGYRRWSFLGGLITALLRALTG